MKGEYHVGFRENVRVKFPRVTRLVSITAIDFKDNFSSSDKSRYWQFYFNIKISNPIDIFAGKKIISLRNINFWFMTISAQTPTFAVVASKSQAVTNTNTSLPPCPPYKTSVHHISHSGDYWARDTVIGKNLVLCAPFDIFIIPEGGHRGKPGAVRLCKNRW